MEQPIHYDLEAFEKKLRADFAAANAKAPPGNEFIRLQVMATEMIVQFGVFLARLDNEEASDDLQIEVISAVVAGLLENAAAPYVGDSGVLDTLLRQTAMYARVGGERVASTDAPMTIRGRA